MSDLVAQEGSTAETISTAAINTAAVTTEGNEGAGGEDAATADVVHTKAESAKTGIEALKAAKEAFEKGTKAAGKKSKKEEAAPAATPAPSPYSPNFKFKVFDEEQKKDIEREFEDWTKGLITTKELEDKFRDLYTKVTGFETVKSSRNKLKNEVQKLTAEAADFKKSLSVLDSFVQGGDFQSFFEALKIPEDKVLRYALDRINYHQLPEDKKREYDNARDLKYRSQILAEDNQRLQQQFLASQASVREQELNLSLQAPDVKAIADAFDTRLGIPGSFRQEVIKRGQYYWHAHQQDIPVAQAIREVVALVGQTAPVQATPTASAANVATPGGAPVPPPTMEVVQAPEKKPVIPNIQGRGTSPAKRLPSSIADLKRLRQEA